MVILYSVLLFITLIYSKFKYYTIFTHVSIFIGVNIISIFLMYGILGIDSKLSIGIHLRIIGMFVFFIIGSFFGDFKYKFKNKNLNYNKYTDLVRLKYAIIVLSIVYNIFSFIYLYRLHSSYGISNIMNNLSTINQAFQNEDFKLGFSYYVLPIGVPLSLMILFYKNKTKCSNLIYIQYLLCYIQCISPRRDTLFFMFGMTLMYSILIKSGLNISNKSMESIKRFLKVSSIICLAVFIMSYTQVAMNKSYKSDFILYGLNIPASLKDSLLYITGNYAYLNKLDILGQLKFNFPFISTFRLFYRYIIEGLFKINIDTVTCFNLQFFNIGSSECILFNTAPLFYYIYIESGFLWWLSFIIIGFISSKAYYLISENRNSIGCIMLSLFQFDILLFSFRSYNLIYLSHILVLIYIIIIYLIVEKKEVVKIYEE